MYPASVSGEYRNNKVSFNFKMEAQNTEGHTVGTEWISIISEG